MFCKHVGLKAIRLEQCEIPTQKVIYCYEVIDLTPHINNLTEIKMESYHNYTSGASVGRMGSLESGCGGH